MTPSWHLCLTLSLPVFAAFLIAILPNTSFHMWVGLNSDPRSQFRWEEPGLLSYTNWAPGEPKDNSGTQTSKTPVLSASLFVPLTVHYSICLSVSVPYSVSHLDTESSWTVLVIYFLSFFLY